MCDDLLNSDHPGAATCRTSLPIEWDTRAESISRPSQTTRNMLTTCKLVELMFVSTTVNKGLECAALFLQEQLGTIKLNLPGIA